jgi:hypothetical protein
MIVSRTVGFKDDNQDRKGYIIYTECGKSFRLEPSNSVGYTCKGIRYNKIKDFKVAIENKDVTMDTDGDEGEDEEVGESPMEEGQDIWDCVHPCALLVWAIRQFVPSNEWGASGYKHSEYAKKNRNLLLEVMRTLGNYGWLNEDGTTDTDKADREFARVENLTKV